MMTVALNDQAEAYLAATVYAVEATSFEAHTLWAHHSYESLYPPWDHRHNRHPYQRHNWEQISPGGMVTVGSLKRGKEQLPVNLSLSWNRINRRTVLFWEQCSQVTDGEQAEKWLAKHCPNWRNSHTNAENFGHCLHAISADSP